jgi:hypothetical protein
MAGRFSSQALDKIFVLLLMVHSLCLDLLIFCRKLLKARLALGT